MFTGVTRSEPPPPPRACALEVWHPRRSGIFHLLLAMSPGGAPFPLHPCPPGAPSLLAPGPGCPSGQGGGSGQWFRAAHSRCFLCCHPPPGDVLFQMAEVHRQIQNQLEEMVSDGPRAVPGGMAVQVGSPLRGREELGAGFGPASSGQTQQGRAVPRTEVTHREGDHCGGRGCTDGPRRRGHGQMGSRGLAGQGLGRDTGGAGLGKHRHMPHLQTLQPPTRQVRGSGQLVSEVTVVHGEAEPPCLSRVQLQFSTWSWGCLAPWGPLSCTVVDRRASLSRWGAQCQVPQSWWLPASPGGPHPGPQVRAHRCFLSVSS